MRLISWGMQYLQALNGGFSSEHVLCGRLQSLGVIHSSGIEADVVQDLPPPNIALWCIKRL